MNERVRVVLPFDFVARATLRGRAKEERYLVRDVFETFVPVRPGRDGNLLFSRGRNVADVVLPILDGVAHHPVCGAEAGHDAPVEKGPVRPERCTEIAEASRVDPARFRWAASGASPVRLSRDGPERAYSEHLTKDFLDRRSVSVAWHDRDARLAAAIDEASHLAVFDGGLHTSLREPVVQGAGRAAFLDVEHPWTENPQVEESHAIETVLASSGRASVEAAGFGGDVDLVKGRIDDLLLGFDLLAKRILKMTAAAVSARSDATFELHGAALAAIRRRGGLGGASASDLDVLVACAEAMIADGVHWGFHTSGTTTPEMAARLRLHYLRDVGAVRSVDEWAEGLDL